MDGISTATAGNVVYCSWFDTVINEHLIRAGGLDIHNAPIVGFCVDSGLYPKQSFAFPAVHAGLRVTLGNSSVRYEVALFGDGDEAPRATVFCARVRRPRVQQERAHSCQYPKRVASAAGNLSAAVASM